MRSDCHSRPKNFSEVITDISVPGTTQHSVNFVLVVVERIGKSIKVIVQPTAANQVSATDYFIANNYILQSIVGNIVIVTELFVVPFSRRIMKGRVKCKGLAELL